MNKLSIGVISGIFAAVMLATPAFAWHFTLSGKGVCQPDTGKYEITWTVDNSDKSTKNQSLKITSSSNPSVVPVGTVIPHTVVTFPQLVDGSKAAPYSLKLTGYWGNNKKEKWTSTAKADLCKVCDQPQTPTVPTDDNPTTPTNPDGGMGAGTTDPTPVAEPVATPVETPQVVVPVGAVNAGNGGAPKTLNAASVAGLIGSAIAAGFGLRGLKKRA